MNDLLPMKQFSQLSGIEVSTLRYWDNIGLFAPAVRGDENNYRYYTPMQVMTARFISVMSKLGIPLKTIKDMEDDRSPEKVAALIAQKVRDLDEEMRRLRDNYSIIHTRLELINYGMKVEEGFNVVNGIRENNRELRDDQEIVTVGKVAVLHRDEAAYIIGPRNKFKDGEDFYEPFMLFCRQAEELRINLGFPIVGYHDDVAAFIKQPGRPNAFISVDPSGNRIREAGNYLVGFCYNYYGRFGDLPDKMAAYAKENKIRTAGPVFTVYLEDELCLKDPNQYLCEISVKVRD